MFPIFLSLFVLIALGRTYLRYRDGAISLGVSVGWTLFWCIVAIVGWRPEITEEITKRFGVGRPVDLLFAVSILVLFYMLFTVYIRLEQMRNQVTDLVRQLSLKDEDDDQDA